MKPTKYTDEEKLKIIGEAKSSGNILATAKRYNISDVTIHGWMKKFNKIKPAKDLHQENKYLKQKLADRDLEISILKDLVKKTVQVWSQEEKSPMNTSPSNLLKQRY
jgi:transposase-like protein